MVLKKNDKVLYLKEYEAVITSVSPARAGYRSYTIRFTDKIPQFLNKSIIETSEENLSSADPNAELLEELREKVRAAGKSSKTFTFDTEMGSAFHKHILEQLEQQRGPLISHVVLDHDAEYERMLKLKEEVIGELWKKL